MKLPIYQIDAFATKAFAGNPAAICPLHEWLADEVMQSIAENLSDNEIDALANYIHGLYK